MTHKDENMNNLIELSNGLLVEAHTDVIEKNGLCMPIAQLSTLGTGVASLLPMFRTITQSTAINTNGLYRLANAGVGDALKVAKNGNSWGAMKTSTGGSKFAQFKEVGSVKGTSTTTLPIDPATVMIAVALYSIEKQMGEIAATAKEILSFLEIEKESEIEADVETLMSIIANYKLNWDNSHYVESNHKMVLDIQRTARKNMLSYQKTVADIIKSKQTMVSQSKIHSKLSELVKKFKYYKMALYTFAMSSLLEIMLGGNFKEEEYIAGIKAEVDTISRTYRDYFERCSDYIEKISSSAVGTNVIKGLGATSNALGRFIGKIPIVKNGQADEFFQEKGDKLKINADERVKEAIGAFGEMSNPKTAVFMEKMNDIVQIFNCTSTICFDKEHIYLVAEDESY